MSEIGLVSTTVQDGLTSAYSLKDQQLQLSSLWRIGQVLVDEVQQRSTLILALKVRWMAREPLLQQRTWPAGVVGKDLTHMRASG